ncbi:MAG: serine hydrolase [Microcoleus sp. PH2017_40_RAT_O_B]|uniref:serine hydrolase n=1 Tax=unclassified Microcoleus TaxID=2642155 RepID=UPI001D77279C|nr:MULTISPECIES: serine hydrolase [unclassified Microcoleus]MCC3575820.1 serine hydrolase [Microcoleus sp. PH2017_34_RAT_O_A]MCC3613531.1 serine hydrolase [Microcoleus sp. PH2017_40_RAT_O_B]
MPGFSRFLSIANKMAAVAASIGLVQVLTIASSLAQSSNPRSLDELYKIRDRLVTQLEQPASPSPEPTLLSGLVPFAGNSQEKLVQQLQEVEVQILVEQRSNDNLQQAVRLANRAVETGGKSNQSIESSQQTQFLWHQALNNLQEVPQNSFLAPLTASKAQEYRENLTVATSQVQQAKSDFLAEVARSSGLSNEASIGICHLSRECVNLRGDVPPISPASLIKVPIAVALMQKLDKEKISLNHEVFVDPGNFTEDSSTKILSRRNYPVQLLLEEMIDRSSNIATNQLIDYLGSDYINQFLENRGYQVTRVNFKLMGEKTMPTNPGSGPNRVTANELTEMMVQIYNGETPGAKLLVETLNQQYDRALGFAALKGSKAQWLGEKTGENSLVLGTTLAMNIDGEAYVMTVIDSRTSGDLQIRKSIAKIADYISNNPSF